MCGERKFSKFFANNVLASLGSSPGKLSKPTILTPSTLKTSFRFVNSQLPPFPQLNRQLQNLFSWI